MKQSNNVFRLAGIFLLVQVLSFAIGSNVFLRPFWENDFLASIADNRGAYITGMLLEFIAGPLFIGYTVIFFTYFKKVNAALANWYFALRTVEFGIIVFSSIVLLSLLNLSEKYGASSASVQALGDTMYWFRAWSMSLLLFVFAINSYAFAYFLYKTKLIPQILSILLCITATILLLGQIANFYGFDLKDAVILPIVIWEIITGLYLIIKGGSFVGEHKTD